MGDYREVDGLFAGLEKFDVDSRSLIESPYIDEEQSLFIEGQILQTLDDEMEIELCLWTDRDSHDSNWDISIDKAMFDGKAKTDFLAYLQEKGLYLENVMDGYGSKWRYCGMVLKDPYRIQYHEEDEDFSFL